MKNHKSILVSFLVLFLSGTISAETLVGGVTPVQKVQSTRIYPVSARPSPPLTQACHIHVDYVGYTLIKTEADLALVRANPSATGKFWLCFNINILAQNWEPISSFSGIFMGNGKTIRNLSIDRAGETNVGFFRTIEPTGIVKFLRFEGPDVTGNQNVGVLAGINRGTIEGVTVFGEGTTRSVHAATGKVGGLVGRNFGTIKKSAVEGNLSVSAGAGEVSEVGGLVGVLEANAVIEDSFVHAQVGAASLGSGLSSVGGLVGKASGNSRIERSVVSGSVLGDTLVGGLVGQSSGKISKSGSSASVSGLNMVGGLLGKHSDPTFGGTPENSLLERSFASGSVRGSTLFGGLVGELYYARILNSFSDGLLNGTSAGSLIGKTTAGLLEDSYTTLTTNLIQAQSVTTTITTSYFLSNSGAPNARTEAQLKSLGTFSQWNMSDLNNTAATIWKIAAPNGTDFPRADWAIPIVASNPPSGAIDARRPFLPDGTNPVGWQEVTLEFDQNPGSLYMTAFSISEVGGDGVAPIILQVNVLSERSVQLILNRPIDFQAWTDFVHKASGTKVRLGYLPGDVDGNKQSGPGDIIALTDRINNLNNLPSWSTDLDRSGATGPADIITLIDLLTGSGAYPEFNGAFLP